MTEAEQRRIREATRVLYNARREYNLRPTPANRNRLRYERDQLRTIVSQNNGLLADENRVFRMANIGKIASMLLIPVGVLAVVGTILTGAVGAVADFAATAGVIGAGGGLAINKFLLSKERMAEIGRRVQKRESELVAAQRELDAANAIL